MLGKVIAGLAVVLSAAAAHAAPISYTGGTYSQDFDSLSNTGTANPWTDGQPTAQMGGWYAASSPGGVAGPIATYRANAGGSNAAAVYSYGPDGTTERALGSLSSATPQSIYYGAQFINNTGATLSSFDLSYSGEEWRATGTTSGPTTIVNTLQFAYSTSASTVHASSGYTAVPALDFTAPLAGAAFTDPDQAVDGNSATYKVSLSSTVTIAGGWAPGQSLWIRWTDVNDAGNDQGLGIDDLTFSATVAPAVPLPASSLGGLALLGGLAARRRR